LGTIVSRSCRELCAGAARGFEDALLVGREPLKVAFDHLPDITRHLHRVCLDS
jgi:hypothetical protein